MRFDPMLPTSNKSKRGGNQIGAELLKLKYGQRTPVYLTETLIKASFESDLVFINNFKRNFH